MAPLSLIFYDFPPSDRPEASKMYGRFSATRAPLSFHTTKTLNQPSGMGDRTLGSERSREPMLLIHSGSLGCLSASDQNNVTGQRGLNLAHADAGDDSGAG
jgi:hypothetical protein